MQTSLLKERKSNKCWERIISLLPRKLSHELEHIAKSRKNAPSCINELRIRADAVSTVVVDGAVIPLAVRVGADELDDIVFHACDGSIYAFRDTLARGYIPLGDGVRLGVCGHARYEGGELVGVSGISTLVFRLPFGECSFADDIAAIFLSSHSCGMLIYAPPGGGKTTVLRKLARSLASGKGARRVCIVDERCEFLPEDYINCTVDILRGYRRAEGIELAVRTLSPEIIVIDEISSEDAQGLADVMRCGIPLIATAHASSIDELLSKPYIAKFSDIGAFDLLVGITRVNREFGFIATGMKS